MDIKLRIIRTILQELINKIDAGNSNHTESELNDIIKNLTKLNRGIKRISKKEACEHILHCSPSSLIIILNLVLYLKDIKNLVLKNSVGLKWILMK